MVSWDHQHPGRLEEDRPPWVALFGPEEVGALPRKRC